MMEKPRQRVTLMRVSNDMKLKWSHSEPSLPKSKESTLAKIFLSSVSLTHAFSTSRTPTTAAKKSKQKKREQTPKRVHLQCHDEHNIPQTIVGVPISDSNDWYVLIASGKDEISVSILRLIIYASVKVIHLCPTSEHQSDFDNLYHLWTRLCGCSKTIYQGTREADDNKRFQYLIQCLHDLLYLMKQSSNSSYNSSIASLSALENQRNVQDFQTICQHAWNSHSDTMKFCVVTPTFQKALSSLPNDFKPAHLQAADTEYKDESEQDLFLDNVINSDNSNTHDEIILAWYFRWMIIPRVKSWNEADVFVEHVIETEGQTKHNYVYVAIELRKWRLFAIIPSSITQDEDHQHDEHFELVREAARYVILQLSG